MFVMVKQISLLYINIVICDKCRILRFIAIIRVCEHKLLKMSINHTLRDIKSILSWYKLKITINKMDLK